MIEQLPLFSDEDPAEVYRRVRDDLQERVVGHSEAVRLLALAGARHLLGLGSNQRFLVIGRSGVGKTTLCISLAEVLDVPHLIIDVASMAETNWSGQDLIDLIDDFASRVDSTEELRRSVLILDEIDKTAIPSGGGGSGAGADSRASMDYRRGKQESLLALLGGNLPVRTGGVGRSHEWNTSSALIVCLGAFSGLEHGGAFPSPADLVRYGMTPELVDRLGTIISLPPLDMPRLAEVIKRDSAGIARTFEEFGFTLEIPDATFRYLARAAAHSGRGAGTRSAVSWVNRAAQALLVRLIEGDASNENVAVLSPDDLILPPPVTES